jgi:hypothetical protein
VGGLAGDDEILAAVAGALPPGTAVGRGDVAGSLGHRYAVAYGLALLEAVGGAAGFTADRGNSRLMGKTSPI